MGKLIAIRHGQSTWNAENRFTGWVDVDLSEKGVQEAEKSGRLLQELNINFDMCFTSYLKRAINTLEIVLKILGKDKRYTKAWELNERHYGALTGLNKTETKKKLGEEQFKKYRRSWDIQPPKLDKDSKYNSNNDLLYKGIKNIPSTESLKNTYERVVPYFEKNIEKQLKENKNIILSAHGNTIRALGKKIFNISDKSINLLEIPTGNPLVINFDNSGKISNAKYLDESRKSEIISNQ
ncbi:MAG: phosphoglyceromutase [Candidatus Marinimicrobia bacterium]|nr:phosphoglyceromutase [Candidatus Neomarinimicrobiota bacterium]